MFSWWYMTLNTNVSNQKSMVDFYHKFQMSTEKNKDTMQLYMKGPCGKREHKHTDAEATNMVVSILLQLVKIACSDNKLFTAMFFVECTCAKRCSILMSSPMTANNLLVSTRVLLRMHFIWNSNESLWWCMSCVRFSSGPGVFWFIHEPISFIG